MQLWLSLLVSVLLLLSACTAETGTDTLASTSTAAPAASSTEGSEPLTTTSSRAPIPPPTTSMTSILNVPAERTVVFDALGWRGQAVSVNVGSQDTHVVFMDSAAVEPEAATVLRYVRCSGLPCQVRESRSLAELDYFAGGAGNLSASLNADDAPIVAFIEHHDPGSTRAILRLVTQDGARTLDSGALYGLALASGPDGRPLLAYYRWQSGAGQVVLLTCGDATCDPELTTRTVLDSGDAFSDLDLTVTESGRVHAAYWTADQGQMRPLTLANCSNPACASTSHSAIPRELPPNVVRLATVDDLPRLLVASEQGLQLLLCEDPGCEKTNSREFNDGQPVFDAALVMAPDDSPTLIWISIDSSLWIAACGDAACENPVVTNTGIIGAKHVDAATGSDGHPIIVYTTDNEVNVLQCRDPHCSVPEPR